jgi:hypothetical protein
MLETYYDLLENHCIRIGSCFLEDYTVLPPNKLAKSKNNRSLT